MKYKVVLAIERTGGGNPDAAVSISFYTRNQAELACQRWVDLGTTYSNAYLWDGNSWSIY